MIDIQAGDVVVCIDAKPDEIDPLADKLVEGRVYRVAVVGNRTPDGVLAVAFKELRSSSPRKVWAFSIRRFRKVLKADQTFTESIRACRPIKIREDA